LGVGEGENPIIAVKVGAPVGTNEMGVDGIDVGDVVSNTVGTFVGASDDGAGVVAAGIREGAPVGSCAGGKVGTAEGEADGRGVGAAVGTSVGTGVGVDVGETVGANDGANVHCQHTAELKAPTTCCGLSDVVITAICKLEDACPSPVGKSHNNN
jgi:hypothetical protein